mgnify:FL=1
MSSDDKRIMLKETIYDWIKKVGEKQTNPNFDDIMIKFSDDYEIKDIEDALEELKEEGRISETNLCGILYYEAW